MLNNSIKILIVVLMGILIAIISIIPVLLTIRPSKSNPVPSKTSSPSFYIIPLGTRGGLEENNLSSYIVTSVNDDQKPNSAYISLDAGTVYSGIVKAVERGALPSNTSGETFIAEQIKAYLISHGHLDHNSGFIINTPNDKAGKYIFGLNETINIIQQSYFNGQSWIDFGPTGFKKYGYGILNPFSNESVPIPDTNFNVRIFRLCHICPYLSSAFLLSRNDSSQASILYLGDTGPDDVEKITQSNNQTYYPRYIDQMWKSISPLIANDQLKAIFIEVSYVNDRLDNSLFGHLTANWLFKELNKLNNYQSIEKVKIIITHIKPEKEAIHTIIQNIQDGNSLNLDIIFPQQGQPIWV